MPSEAQATTPPIVVYKHKRGRPRKVNVRRSPAGKSLGEDPFAHLAFQPHRCGFANPKDDRLGYPLGRLRVSGQISGIQHRAGNEWGLLVRSYAGIMGIRVSSPKSGSDHPEIATTGISFGGPLEGSEEHVKRVASLRGRYDACFERLASLGRSVGRGHALLVAARRVCIEEVFPSDAELGDLRLALNALAHELKIEE